MFEEAASEDAVGAVNFGEADGEGAVVAGDEEFGGFGHGGFEFFGVVVGGVGAGDEFLTEDLDDLVGFVDGGDDHFGGVGLDAFDFDVLDDGH